MFFLASCSEVANRNPSPSPVEVENRKVSALARLIPKGDLVKLSIPASTTITGNEVVEHWFIEEGSFIKKGDKFATVE